MIFFLVMDNPREVWRKIQEREGQIKKHAINFDAGQQIEEHTYCASTLSEFLDKNEVNELSYKDLILKPFQVHWDLGSGFDGRRHRSSLH